MSHANGLDRITLFRSMSQEARSQFAKQCRWQKFASGQEIMGHNDQSLDVYFMAEGTARIIIYSFSGRPVIFRDVRPGEVFGEFAAIDGRPRSATVEATSDCLTGALRPDAFWDSLLSHPMVARDAMIWLTAQSRALTRRVLEFSTLAVRNRLHAELLRLAREDIRDDGSAVVSPVPTHADLASRISTHREAVTREMSRLTREGLIDRQGDLLVICSLQKLGDLVEEVLGESLLNLESGDSPSW